MKLFRRKMLSFLLVVLLVFAAMPLTVSANDESVTVSDPQSLVDAIANIRDGDSGVINIVNMGSLSDGLSIQNKNVTFNLVNSPLQCGSGGPIISGVNANITINLDSQSSIMATGNTGNKGVVRIENSTGVDEYTLSVNGGRYTCIDQADSVFVATLGTKVVLTDVVCEGNVISDNGKLIVNSGKFTSDVRAYAADGKYSCAYGENYYVRDKEMTDDFSTLLSDGKIILDYAKPSYYPIPEYLIADEFCTEHPGISCEGFTFNEDFTKLSFGINCYTAKEEFHDVDVVWNYDKNVSDAAESFVKQFPIDREWFHVSDLELVNYWTYCDPDSEIESLANYSGELKSYLNNTNFLCSTQAYIGSEEVFYTEQIGPAKIFYNDTVYFAAGELGARAEHAIYVPESTDNTQDALIAAAQKKIDDYIGKDKVKITATNETVTAYCNNESSNYDNPQDFTDRLNEGGDLYFLNRAEGDFVFNVEVVEKGDNYKFVIIKDDTKLAVPSYATVDLNTKVSVTADSSSVPLDTVIEVKKITEGADYNNIIEVLDVEENETFDIKLHSGSLNSYFTKLEDGKFEVKIPVPDKFKGKNLTVYYVDQNNNPIEYEVTVKDNFATFVTDHFSIYTLAEKASQQIEHTQHSGGSATCCTKAICSECNQPYGEFNSTNHSGGTEIKNAKEATVNEKGYTGDTYCKGCGEKIADGKDIPATGNGTSSQTGDNKDIPATGNGTSPQTGDNSNLWLWMVLAFVSGGMFFGTILWKRKEIAEENR